jgi:hypothetical protein
MEKQDNRGAETLKLAGSIPASAFLRLPLIFGFDPKAKNLL